MPAVHLPAMIVPIQGYGQIYKIKIDLINSLVFNLTYTIRMEL